MQNNSTHPQNIHYKPIEEPRQPLLSIGFFLLSLFALLRPITLTFEYVTFYSLSPFEVFAAFISYILLIPVIMYFQKITIDRTTFTIFVFCLYSFFSILWGSNLVAIFRITLPFIIFFASRLFITNSKQIGILLFALVIGYIMPIFSSTYDILVGRGVEMLNYWTQMQRYEGNFTSSHTFAYSMLFFSFIFCFIKNFCQLNNNMKKYLIFVLLFATFFCLYKSYTRTAFVGFFIFWSVYLYGSNKKYFVYAILLFFIIGIFFFPKASAIFWNSENGKRDLNAASSGRISIWQNNTKIFINDTTSNKLLGHGLGSEGHHIRDSNDIILPSHNDYLSLIMSLGLIGLFLYLFILFSLLLDILHSNLPNKNKFLFLGVTFSIMAMNYFSNAVIFRVELSQYFWLFMGIFYFLDTSPNSDRLPTTDI